MSENLTPLRKNAERGIPRKARHRSGPQDWRARICILTGINDAGDIFFEMTGRGNMGEEQAKWDSRARAALPLAMGAVSKAG